MRAIRLCLTQNVANYRKEETIDNKMTYPLPPYSTVIGAVHVACGYTEYHPMKISVQGHYGGMVKKVYVHNGYLNSLQNDRGILVKMVNPDLLSSAYVKVAEAQKAQGNDFFNGVTIKVYDEECLEEYRELKRIGNSIAEFKKGRFAAFKKKIKKYKETIATLKQKYANDAEKMRLIKIREKRVKDGEKYFKNKLDSYEKENYKIPFSKFRTLTRAPKYYELLTDVELTIHIVADAQTLADIQNNAYNIKALGRSEDFVQVKECKIVELSEVDGEYTNPLSGYVPLRAVPKMEMDSPDKGIKREGTRYSLPKNYIIDENKQRKFKKKSVLYTSNYLVDTPIQDVFIDKEDNKNYIVCLA